MRKSYSSWLGMPAQKRELQRFERDFRTAKLALDRLIDHACVGCGTSTDGWYQLCPCAESPICTACSNRDDLTCALEI